MVSRHAVAALFLSQLIAAAAFAQTAVPAPPSEFGRVSGGEIEAITKNTDRLSGSLGIGLSRSLPFASGSGRRYNATLGGTILQDRLWFFGTAEQSDPIFSSRYPALAQNALSKPSRSTNAKMTAQLGDRQSLAASFASARDLGLMTVNPGVANPSSFLSLHYTGIVSDHMFFTGTVTRSSTSQSLFPFATADPQR